jgi:hypothetical protein
VQADPFNVRDHLLEAGLSANEVERMLRAVKPGALIDDHRLQLGNALAQLQDLHGMTGESYGNFYGGDPRDFRPDPEGSTPEERERHRLACEAADRGEAWALNSAPGSGVSVIDGQAALAQFSDSFGLGTTNSVDVDLEHAMHGIETAIGLCDLNFTATSLPPVFAPDDLKPSPSQQAEHDVEGSTAALSRSVGAQGS